MILKIPKMTKKRIRIDMEDVDGARYDIKLEGNVTREKVLKIFSGLQNPTRLRNNHVTNALGVPSLIY